MNDWIDSPERLRACLAGWAAHEAVALDTEFVRERTWHPQLALVQIAVPGEVALIDPLSGDIAEALRPWLADTRVVKLMHSAGEDLQAFAHACGAVPAPLFDTQIAAAMSGYGAGIGYQKLVEQVVGVALPKGETRSDWLRRPLTPAQLEYAADDVRHLHALHAALAPRLDALGRRDWHAEDCARLAAQAQRDAPEAWPHLAVRSAQFLDADAQARLCRLLRWRERQARALDRPKNWILDGELAVSLARRPPVDLRGFHAFLDAQPKAPRRHRAELWAQLIAPLNDDERRIPLAAAPDDAQKSRLRQLQDAVAAESARRELPEGLLASRRHLEALLERGEWPSALAGWRRAILEPVLTPLLAAA